MIPQTFTTYAAARQTLPDDATWFASFGIPIDAGCTEILRTPDGREWAIRNVGSCYLPRWSVTQLAA